MNKGKWDDSFKGRLQFGHSSLSHLQMTASPIPTLKKQWCCMKCWIKQGAVSSARISSNLRPNGKRFFFLSSWSQRSNRYPYKGKDMEKRALLITCLVLLICTKDMMARNLKTSYKKKVSLEPKHNVLVSTVTPAYAFGSVKCCRSRILARLGE